MARALIYIQTLLCLHLLVYVSLGQVSFPAGKQNIRNAKGDSGMVLYYEFYDDNSTLRMGLDMNSTVDYYAVGFAPKGHSGMPGFDMVAFVFAPDATTGELKCTIMDLYATEYDTPKSDTSMGGTNDYTLIDYYAKDGRTSVVFERLWDTNDQWDFVFDKDTVIDTGLALSWAWMNKKEYKLDYHDQAGTIEFKMDDSNASPLTFTDWAYYVHKYGLLLCWVVLIEIAIQFGRYHKYSKYALNVHRILTAIIYVFTVCSSILLVYLSGIDTALTAGFIHFIIGVTIMTLLTFQALFGSILGFLITKLAPSNKIPRLNKFHMISGILTELLAKGEAALGLYLYLGIEMMCALLVLYAGIISYRILQEIELRSNNTITEKNLKDLDKADSEKLQHKQLMDLLNRNVPVNVILETPGVKGLKWAMLDNKVFEIKDFDHPGGNFMMELIVGREVGRFLYGAYGLEIPGGTKQHSHSKLALMAIQTNFIGTIRRTHDILVTDDRTVQTPSSGLDNSDDASMFHSEGLKKKLLAPAQMTKRWVLQNKTAVTYSITKFEFSCPGHFVNTGLNDIRNLGRHLKISHAGHSKSRLYTMIFSQTEQRIQKRALLSKTNEDSSNLRSVSVHSNVLPLVIKNYGGSIETFSGFLHYSTLGTNGFLIEGPFGPGFGLTTETTGLHYIIAGGTGILPFLDLFDYLLEGLVDPTSATNIFKNGFKLHVIASFGQIVDFVGLDICQQLIQTCRAKGIPDAFKLTLRVKGLQSTEHFEVVNSEFDNAFIAQNVDKKCARVFVCGPPRLNELVPAGLVSAGIEQSRIDIV